MRLALVCFYCLCVFVYVLYFIATMSFAGYFLPVLFCMLSMLISDSRFDLVWFRLSCDHGWIRSGSVNVRKQQQQLCRDGNRTRPSRHVPATAAELGPRAMYLGGFHRPHCAATATELGPRAMYLLRQQHPALAPFISRNSDSDHSRRSDRGRRDHR